MALEPNNTEVNADLKEARSRCSQEELNRIDGLDMKVETGNTNISQPAPTGQFKRIQIQEDSESDEEQKETNDHDSKGTDSGKKIDNALTKEEEKNLKEKLMKLDELKAKGQSYIKSGAYEKAIIEFEQCLNLLNNLKTKFNNVEDANGLDYVKRKAVYLNNIAFSNMQLDMPKKVIEYTSRVIELKNVDVDVMIKAYMRRGILSMCTFAK